MRAGTRIPGVLQQRRPGNGLQVLRARRQLPESEARTGRIPRPCRETWRFLVGTDGELGVGSHRLGMRQTATDGVRATMQFSKARDGSEDSGSEDRERGQAPQVHVQIKPSVPNRFAHCARGRGAGGWPITLTGCGLKHHRRIPSPVGVKGECMPSHHAAEFGLGRFPGVQHGIFGRQRRCPAGVRSEEI